MHPAGGPVPARGHLDAGSAGEQAAAAHLESAGYRILARNVRAGGVEADLVAEAPGGAIAVVEVKARRGPFHAEERVGVAKRARLVRFAEVDPVVRDRQAGHQARVEHGPHAGDADG
ncbi:MAG: YraN family protein [Phycisphaerales bacterium]